MATVSISLSPIHICTNGSLTLIVKFLQVLVLNVYLKRLYMQECVNSLCMDGLSNVFI